MQRLCISLCLLFLLAVPARAQIETTPLGRAAPPTQPDNPPVTPAPVAPPAPTVAGRSAEPPPVLPQKPRRKALESAATGGAGGMSYAGPSGAMNTSPYGASCAVTCALQPAEQYQVSCAAGFTAMCQCDTIPHAGCRKQ